MKTLTGPYALECLLGSNRESPGEANESPCPLPTNPTPLHHLLSRIPYCSLNSSVSCCSRKRVKALNSNRCCHRTIPGDNPGANWCSSRCYSSRAGYVQTLNPHLEAFAEPCWMTRAR